jgi:hypothetical protein
MSSRHLGGGMLDKQLMPLIQRGPAAMGAIQILAALRKLRLEGPQEFKLVSLRIDYRMPK